MVLQKRLQQLEFERCESNFLIIRRRDQSPAHQIKIPVTKFDLGLFLVGLGPNLQPPQDASRFREYFPEMIGLGDINLRAEFQSNHPVDDLAAAGQNNQSRFLFILDFARERQPVFSGKPQIQQHQRDLFPPDAPAGIFDVFDRDRPESSLDYIFVKLRTYIDIVFDIENFCAWFICLPGFPLLFATYL